MFQQILIFWGLPQLLQSPAAHHVASHIVLTQSLGCESAGSGGVPRPAFFNPWGGGGQVFFKASHGKKLLRPSGVTRGPICNLNPVEPQCRCPRYLLIVQLDHGPSCGLMAVCVDKLAPPHGKQVFQYPSAEDTILADKVLAQTGL